MTAQVSIILDELEQALKAQGWWCEQPPSAMAMASTAPFCCDTMPLEQWLQFVLLVKMRALLETGAELPSKIAILPMAEYQFAHHGEQVSAILNAIAKLDQCLNTL